VCEVDGHFFLSDLKEGIVTSALEQQWGMELKKMPLSGGVFKVILI
jgi:hypothetical protein